ncbi:non-symbiotic hemoglobin 2 [Brachionus plicatilis]|uniref:Non-symbiotic hemoglobin 2 n=1 Tax=Brachionus plicatilis TaxID=10195 RepID=A0A3M7PVR7_BRAPC|nr:non-symbiotic hemoglobin 2 [Brachionus plicatilis]
MGSCSSTDLIDKHDQNSLLSTSDIILLRNSWREIVHQGQEKFAVEFMVRLFTIYPNFKHLWWFLKDVNTEENLRNNSQVLVHGQKMFDAIDKSIYSLEDINSCCFALINLGRIHFKIGVREEHFKLTLNLKPIYEVLTMTLADGLGENFDNKTKNCWKKFLTFIECQMKIGFEKN